MTHVSSLAVVKNSKIVHVHDDDIFRFSAFLSEPLCARTTDVQVPAFIDPLLF